jgi:hypothetical protein
METVQRRLAELEHAVEQDLNGIQFMRSSGWMAPTARGRAEQRRRYRKAEEHLKERLVKNAQKPSDKRLPDKHVVISVSDSEAALGRDKEKVFGPCYSVQCVAESASLIIVAFDIAARATDAGTLAPLLDRTCGILGTYPKQHLVDAGYVSILDLKDCATRKVELIGPVQENDLTARKPPPKSALLTKEAFTWLPEKQTYLCPEGHEFKQTQRRLVGRSDGRSLMQSQFRCPPIHCRVCPLSLNCCRNPNTGRTIGRLDGEELLDEHRLSMKTPRAQKLKKMRGALIERVFADFKAHRGLRRLHGRGLSRATAEIGLIVIAYNLQRWNSLRKNRHKSRTDTD